MKRAYLILISALIFVGSSATQGQKPIQLFAERSANPEALKLNRQAYDQMIRGDLTNAARTIELAMQKDPTLWVTYFSRARLFQVEGKFELAIQDCNWVLRKHPDFIEAVLLRAYANAHLRRYNESLKELDNLIRMPLQLDSYARTLQARACILATSRDKSVRNGAQAVKDAKLACKLTNWDDGAAIEILALAYAETGDFDSAMLYAEQARTTKGATPLTLRSVERDLAFFKQHKPVRL